jgi:hypothetical protein
MGMYLYEERGLRRANPLLAYLMHGQEDLKETHRCILRMIDIPMCNERQHLGAP